MSGSTLPMPDAVALLSSRTKCGEDIASRFLHEFPTVLANGLAADGSVTISGLGKFKLLTDVDGSVTVDFAPEPSLADAVNEPFAMFESVELADSISEQELDALQEADLKSSVCTSPPVSAPAAQSATPPLVPVDDAKEETDATTETDAKAAPKTEITDVTSDISPSASATAQTPPPVPERYTRATTTENADAHAHPDTHGKSATKDNSEAPALPAAVEVRNRVEVAHSYDTPVPVRLEPESEVAIRQSGHPTLTLVAIAVAACLIGILGGYFLFHQPNIGLPANVEIVEDGILIRNQAVARNNAATTETEAVETDTVSSTIATESTAMTDAEASAEVSGGEVAPSKPVEVTDTVRPGNYLSVMSRRHYGNPKFWVYIYLENKDKIKNPDNLENGMVLVIPPREKYDIDPSSKESLEKAQREAYNILRD